MYTASWVQETVQAMKDGNVPKSDIIRTAAEMRLGWQYVYASQGQDCTPEWRRSRIPYCPSQKYVDMINGNCPVLSGKQPACDGCDFVDTDVFDCAGFVLNEMQLAGVPMYGKGASTQWNTSSNWVAKGEISTMPENLVCAVYKRKDGKMSHAGLSMGDDSGGVVHCSTFVKRGNAYTDNPKWTHWGIPRGLYTTDELRKAGIDVSEDDNMPTLRRGSRGEQVKLLQEALNETPAGAGMDLKADGIFGAETEKAVRQFQADHGLTVDGVVGKKTWKALGITPGTNDKNHNQPMDDGNNTVDRARYIWDKLYTAIRNPYGVAGLMGNLQAESGLNPENLQGTGERALGMTDAEYTAAVDSGAYTAEQFTDDGYGYGIAQWTYRTRKAALLKYAKEQGKSIGNLDMQLDFLLDELLGSYSSVWYALLNATTVREASDAVLLKYERPKNTTEENQQRRAEIGQEFFDRFADVDSEPETAHGDTVAIGRTTLKALYAQAKALTDTLRKLIEGTDTDG